MNTMVAGVTTRDQAERCPRSVPPSSSSSAEVECAPALSTNMRRRCDMLAPVACLRTPTRRSGPLGRPGTASGLDSESEFPGGGGRAENSPPAPQALDETWSGKA
jgi:hypothetical protein